MRRVLIAITVFAVMLTAIGSISLLLIKKQGEEPTRNINQQIQLNKPIVPGPDNIGPQGPALIPTQSEK